MPAFHEKKSGIKSPNAKIQPKLKIGNAGDKYEKEADAVAEKAILHGSKQGHNIKGFANSETGGDSSAENGTAGFSSKNPGGHQSIRYAPGIPNVQLKATPPSEQIQATEDPEPPTEQNLLATKGNGSSLPPVVKHQMESAMQEDFSAVRIHNNSQSAKMSRSIGAQAFTHQQDIYFNKGQFDPSSQAGKLLIAHELAHTIQQKNEAPRIQCQEEPPVLTSPLFQFPEFEQVLTTDLVIGRSQDNSVGARGEFLRSLNQALSLLYPDKKEKLLRDDTFYSVSTKKTVKRFQEEHGLPIDGVVGKQTLLMLDAFHFRQSKKGIAHQKALRGKVMFQDDAQWTNAPDNGSFLLFMEGQRHFIVRADEIALRTPIVLPEVDVVGTTAVGRGGTRVVVTESGRAILLDAGYGNGVTYAVYERQLQNLLGGLGVEQITSIAVTHPHSDHITALEQLIETHSIRAENLIIGGQFQFEERLQERLRNLANNPGTRLLGYHRFDFARQFEGARTGEYNLLASINQGRLRVSFFASEAAINNLRRNVEGRTIKAADVDAASLMARIEAIGSEFKMVVLGDLRGIDYLELERNMESARPGSFERLFRNVTSLSGMQHHLGRINDARDVTGIMRVLEVTVGRLGKVSVIAQTKGNAAQEVFARALAHLGVEVFWTGTPGEGNLSGEIVAQSRGNIRVVGTVGSIQPTSNESAMAERIATMNQLRTGIQNVVADSPKLMEDAEFAEYRRAVEETARELNRLYRERSEITLRRLERKTETEVSQIEFSAEELELNRNEIMRQRLIDQLMEAKPELRESINFMVNSIGRAEEIAYELELMSRSGRSNRLISLIHAVSPQYARTILRSNPNVTAVRFYRLLEQQAELAHMTQSMGGATSMKTKVGAGLLAILVIAHDVGIPLYQAIKNRNKKETNEAWNILLWWHEKGVYPTLEGTQDGKTITDQAKISAAIAENSLDGFSMTGISEENWQRFRLWLSANVINFNDYNRYFLSDPVRIYSRSGKFVTTSDWYLKMPSYDGSFSIRTEANATFTQIMDVTAEEMARNTGIELDLLFEDSQPKTNPEPTMQSFEAASPNAFGSLPTGITNWEGISVGYRPLRRLRFRKGADQNAYSYYDQTPAIKAGGWWNDGSDVAFFEVARPEILRNWGTIPSGFRLVMGANYNTYAQLVTKKMTQYSTQPPVQMPSKYFDGAFYSWDKDRFSDVQAKAYKQHREQPLIAKMNHTELSSTWGFEIHYPGVGPNWHGLALVKKADTMEV